MVDSEIKVEKSTIEEYLLATFSKIHDEYGQTLDITLALPTLLQVMSGEDKALDDKKYHFIGEAACQFSIRCILAKHYAHYDDRILEALAKKFRALARMNSLLTKEIGLKHSVPHILPLNILQTISGVLHTFVGLPAVEKFIESSVLQIIAIELGQVNAANAKPQRKYNALEKFNILISQHGGSVKTVASETPSKQWQTEVIARLKPTSALFSAKRTASSKNKAKSAATQDILNYFEKNPDVYNQLGMPGVESDHVHPLPIEESDYSDAVDPTTPNGTTNGNGNVLDPNNVHVSLNHDEDAVKQLSRLLLGDGSDTEDSDVAESPTKKRMREYSRPNGMTGMECMFPNAVTTDTTVTVKTEETIPNNTFAVTNTSTATATAPTMMRSPIKEEEMEANFNPYIGSEQTIEINPRIIKYFKDIFKTNNNTLSHAVTMPGQSKSIFLSLVVHNQDKVQCDYLTRQVGAAHAPVFSAEVVLKSKQYGNVIITADGVAKKKKDAECVAFQKLVIILH
ncbi:hypothetical protein EDC94DRAFT_617366 [Helicostylum pulchrum]|nr:hypothetical protein EDC94DRAFT_617366 [Helicostylum pulchrum]